MDQDKIIIEVLVKQVKELTERLNKADKKIAELTERLLKYEKPKNSRNSSIPPSQDQNRPNRTSSLRVKTGKKPGGQLGHEGNTLQMVENPNSIETHVPTYCNCCGNHIDGIIPELVSKRQVVDIPKIEHFITEHQVFQRTCTCGHVTTGAFPENVKTPVSYGQNIESLIGYLHAYQYLPFKRMQGMLNTIFNINISEGGIHCLLNRFANKTTPFYEQIRRLVSKSEVVGGDETGAIVNGVLNWFWTWQTQNYTYIAYSNNRGMKTINEHFPNGFPNSTFISDGWRAQQNTVALNYQTCIAHLLRDLKGLNEKYPKSKWAKELLLLFYKALELERKMTPDDYNEENKERNEITKRFTEMLNEPPDLNIPLLKTFYNRMIRERDRIFTFMFVPDVPADNNGSERAIRNVKVKQKISGQFKTETAAQNFAKIRSVIDTFIKNGVNVFDGLSAVGNSDRNLRYTD